MNYENSEKYLSNDNQDYYENSFSNNDCFINSNPIYNYNDINISKLSNAISIKYEEKIKPKKKKNKIYKFCNLNDPKLIDAYNEGYYGLNNIPKQYYIYPRFTKKEYYKQKKNLEEPLNDIQIDDEINKENDDYINKSNREFNNYNNNNNNDEFISSYTNYPYPKLINISSHLFGSIHSSRQNPSYSKYNSINNNNELDRNQNLSNDNFEINNFNINNEENTREKNENFYFINNTITKRNVPFQNLPDDISIDDGNEELEE
jgi:hypothetical protein